MSHLTRLIRFIRHWHARIGVLAAVFFLMLALTGLALNHTDALQLAKRQVHARWLMHWYGLRAEPVTQGYRFDRGYFVGDRQHWLMDGRLLPAAESPVIGAVETGGLRYVATRGALYVYLADGTPVDRLTGQALPDAALERIGREPPRLLVQTSKGLFATSDGLDWQPAAPSQVEWARLQPLPAAFQREATALLGPGLPLERVLLDIHSGRILGRYGPWLMDLAALVLTALSLSGVWIYLRSLRRRS